MSLVLKIAPIVAKSNSTCIYSIYKFGPDQKNASCISIISRWNDSGFSLLFQDELCEHFFSKLFWCWRTDRFSPKLWAIIWKRQKIMIYRNNLISSNQFHEKYHEINFTLEVVFIKIMSQKKNSWNQFSIQSYLITLLFQDELWVKGNGI